MIIQIELFDGNDTEIKIYRQIAQHNYTAYVAGFYANKDNYKAGVMAQLKGKQRTVLHTFGKEW